MFSKENSLVMIYFIYVNHIIAEADNHLKGSRNNDARDIFGKTNHYSKDSYIKEFSGDDIYVNGYSSGYFDNEPFSGSGYGEYRAKRQCKKWSNLCWCVDDQGREIPNTKQKRHKVNCKHIYITSFNNKDDEPIEDHFAKKIFFSEDFSFEKIDDELEHEKVLIRQVVLEKQNKDNFYVTSSILMQPGILAGIIGGSVIGLLCFILFLLFLKFCYRKRRKEDKSPILRNANRNSLSHVYSRTAASDFYV